MQVVLPDPVPGRLDKALAAAVPEAAGLSRSRLARLIAAGAVTRAGVALTDPSGKVAAGEVLEVALPAPEPSHDAPQALPLAVLFEDDDLIVIDKPAGMVVHPAPGSRDGTLVNALLHHCGPSLAGVGGARRPGIVHRLDKDTSGVLVAAKSDRAHHGLSEQFAAHSVERHYAALVHGVPERAEARLAGLPGVGFEEGGVLRIATRLGRHPVDRQRQAVLKAGGRHAVTRARIEARFGSPPALALIDCWLETGRTHQIRVHMAHVGHPLIGDPVYGGRRRLPARALSEAAAQAVATFPRQALHAATLGFTHPLTGARMRFAAPLPPDMAALIAALEG